MLIYAAMLFALAAVMGVTMAIRHFGGRDLPLPLPLSHGLFAGAGFALLGYVLMTQPVSSMVWLVFGLFAMAAVGGGMLFRSYWRRTPLSSGMIIIHAMVAGMGLLFLLVYLMAVGLVEEPSASPQIEASDESGPSR